MPAPPRRQAALTEPLLHRFDHAVQGESTLQMQFRSEPDLSVDHAVGGEILGAFPSDAHEALVRLHHPDGVGERLEVEHQILAVGSSGHPGGERLGVVGRQALVPELGGELDDRRGPEAAVEMVVQHDLRGAVDGGRGGRWAHARSS